MKENDSEDQQYRVYPCFHEIRQADGYVHRAIPAADGVVVKIHTDAGITGIGETGDTSVWYMGDSQDSIMHLINKVYGPQIRLGEDLFKIEKIVARMDRSVKPNHILKR